MATPQNAVRIAAASVAQVYRQYQAELRLFFRSRAHDPNSVEDLVQMVYTQLLACRPRQLIRDPKSYLYRSARRVLHRENRRARLLQTQTLSGDAHEWEALASHSRSLWIEDDTCAEVTLARCREALGLLPAGSQAALLLQYRDGRSYEEIARELGVSIHTVKKYIGQALRAIHEQLDSSSSASDTHGSSS